MVGRHLHGLICCANDVWTEITTEGIIRSSNHIKYLYLDKNKVYNQ